MTQEFVTLPREVVEQAIDALYCTDSEEGSPAYNFELKAIKELRAALEQPQVEQEICCKIWSVNRIDDLGKIVDSSGRLIATVYGSQADKIVACHNSYTQQRHEREPLTDEEIDACFPVQWEGDFYQPWRKTVARAIEAAHNIK